MNLWSEEEYYHKLDNLVLASCHHVQQLFQSRWKAETGGEWVNDPEHVHLFLSGHGKKAFKKADSYQKKILKGKHLNEWDIQLLFLILQNFGDKEKYAQENDAVYNLKKMRNDLAHHKTKKIPKLEYDAKLAEFKSHMKSLEMENDSVEKLLEKMGVTSALKAAEAVANLHKKADEFLNKGKFDNAIGCFSEAVDMPSLLPTDLGIAYERRSECWLSAGKTLLNGNDECERALLDAKKALELNDLSWNAHYLAAKCYQWKNNLSKAQHHYERSLALSPGQTQVKSDFDSCKILMGGQNRKDHLNPRMMPTNLQETLAQIEHDIGLKLTKEQFVALNSSGITCEGQSDVFEGRQFYCGWDRPQNFAKAAECYGKAAAVKNTEGMYLFALCYYYGQGVNQDIPKALKILFEVAAMDNLTPGHKTPLKFNAGVAWAKLALGLSYSDGIGVERNDNEAAKWYEKAMEDGSTTAAYNRGNAYLYGKGIPKDEKQAEYCFQQALILRCPNAPAALMSLYIDQLEPQKAENMMQIGRKLDNAGLLRASDEKFKLLLQEVKAKRNQMEPELLEFEKSLKLNIEGLTFKERLRQKFTYKEPALEKAMEVYENSMKNYCGEMKSWAGMAQMMKKYDFLKIAKKAREGSSTAAKVVETFTNCLKINDVFEEHPVLTFDQEREVIYSFYVSVTPNHHLLGLCLTKESAEKLKSILAKWLAEKGNDPGEDDMKVRFCYVVFNLSGSFSFEEDMLGVELLKEGIRRYPDNEHYYDLLSNTFGCKQMFRKGLTMAEKGLQKFPDHAGLLFCRAGHMEKGPYSDNRLEYIAAYQKFLEVAPVDDRHFPEVCYRIAIFYIAEEEEEKVKLYFRRGQEAEEQQLPCHLPYGESQAKILSEAFLRKRSADFLSEMIPGSQKSTDTKPKSVLKRKRYLQSPTRKLLILEHRRFLKELAQEEIMPNRLHFNMVLPPKLRQKVPGKMTNVKPIYLGDMNPTEDHIFENRAIELTILDEPNNHWTSISLIAEDENGDVARLYVYNVAKSRENLHNFQPGCKISIVNPYMRIGASDVTNGIRNDEPRCIMYLEKVENMCRFCGEGNAAHKCSICMRPYCSEECQRLDWKMLKHKLICVLN